MLAPVLIKMDDYEKVRHLLSMDDKQTLTDAICGHCVCPHGLFVEVTPNTDPIIAKIQRYGKKWADGYN